MNVNNGKDKINCVDSQLNTSQSWLDGVVLFTNWEWTVIFETENVVDFHKFLDSYFEKNPKLDKKMLYELVGIFYSKNDERSLGNYIKKYPNVFSNISYEELFKIVPRIDGNLLNAINFPYNSEWFDILKKLWYNVKDYEWHDLKKAQILDILWGWVNIQDVDYYLSMLKDWEVDEELIYNLLWNRLDAFFSIINFYFGYDSNEALKTIDDGMLWIKEILDKYNIDYVKFFKYSFMFSKLDYVRIFGKNDESRSFAVKLKKYLRDTNVKWFIPENMEEILNGDDSVKILKEKDFIRYYDKVECDVEFDAQWQDQKFVLCFNPISKEMKLVSRSKHEMLHHEDFYKLPGNSCFIILWWWWIRNWELDLDHDRPIINNINQIFLYWESKDFWWFKNYLGLVIRIIKEKYPNKHVIFEEWNSRKFSTDDSYYSWWH